MNTQEKQSTAEQLHYAAFNMHSWNAGKVNKKDAMKALERVAELFDPDSQSFRDLATAYQHLIKKLPKPKKAKSAFEWVARAVSEDQDRRFFQYVHADENRIVATDGRRLHVALRDRPEGFYDPRTGTQVAEPETMQFPNIDRVIPDYTTLHDRIHIPSIQALEAEPDSYRCRVVSDSGTSYYFNKRYLTEAAYNTDELTLYGNNPAKPTMTYYDDYTFAVIMPMQPPREK